MVGVADDATIKEQRILIRTLEANLKIKKAEGAQLVFRGELCKKVFLELDRLESSHILRVYEALCSVEFPDDDARALRDMLARKEYRFLNLRAASKVTIPRAKSARPGAAQCPHN